MKPLTLTSNIMVMRSCFLFVMVLGAFAVPTFVGAIGTGAIDFCFINQVAGEVVSQNLPLGSYTIELGYRIKDGDPIQNIGTVSYSSADFSPNQRLVSSQPDMQCITKNALPYGYYYYSYKSISDGLTIYSNDQYNRQVKTTADFYLFSETEDENSDGYIVIGASRPNRVLISLSSYPGEEVKSEPELLVDIKPSSEHHYGQLISLSSFGLSTSTETTLSTIAINQVLGTSTYRFSQALGLGTRGRDVLELQRQLAMAGYFRVGPTGYFGPITRMAVISYQKANKLPGTGYVGKLTLAVLNGAAASGNAERLATIAKAQDQLNLISAQVSLLMMKK